MTGFASNLFKALFKRKSTRLTTERRRPAVRRRAALGFEALDVRAVLSTVVPTTVADDVVVDGRVITGEAIETTEFNIRKLTGRTNYDAAGTGAHAGGGGGGAGKVSMRDFLFSRPSGATSLHSGGVNVGLGDGSVRFVSDSISLVAWATDQDLAGTSGSGDGSGGRGLGTVFYHLLPSSADAESSAAGAGDQVLDFSALFEHAQGATDRDDLLVDVGEAQPHVKVLDATRSGETFSFFAFGGYDGGVRVGVGDIDASVGGGPTTSLVITFQGDRLDPAIDGRDNTTGSSKVSVAVIDPGIDYSHPDLYRNIWVNPNEIPG